MAATNVQGGLTIDLLQNGDNLNTILMATKPLYQTFKKGTDDFAPNWATAPQSDQPIIFPRIHSVMEQKDLTPTDTSWEYNGVPMRFDSSGTCIEPTVAAGKVQLITHNSLPALRMIGNVASETNNDSDNIAFSGYVNAGGQRIKATAEITLLIEEATANLYRLFLNMDDDTIDGDEESVTMTATLFNQGAPITRGVQFEFLKIDDEVIQSKRALNTLKITRAMIDAELLVIARAYVDNKVVAEAQRQVWDSTDPYTIVFDKGNRVRQAASDDVTYNYSLMNTRNGNTRSATFEITVYRNTDKEVITSDFSTTNSSITVTGAKIAEHRSIYVHVKTKVQW